MNAAPARRERRATGTGVQVFTGPEMQALLRCARVLTPTGADEWEAVWIRYRATFAQVKHRAVRNPELLKSTFEELLNTKKTVGELSPELREAQEIQALIDAKRTRAVIFAPRPDNAVKKYQHQENIGDGCNSKVPKLLERKRVPTTAHASAAAQSPGPPKPKLLERKHVSSHAYTHPVKPPTTAPLKPSLKRATSSIPTGRPLPSPKKRKVEPVVNVMEEQAERMVLKLQLNSERAERQRLQHKVDRLEMKMDDLRDSHRKEVEKLRSKSIKLKLKLNRILGALCVLRATHPTPPTETD